ncbi:hypothetical protein B0H14DRAFT_2616017 [Mycena olivaceomarginata]|nr:hypothetical protein B0H14DRAFT_2616017 [Mycena olivaceomarginata]
MENTQAPNELDRQTEDRQQSHQRRCEHAERAFHRAQQLLRVSPAASRAHAAAEVARCRRLLVSLSGPPPTSSDEEVGRFPLDSFGCLPEVTRRPAVVTSDDDYYSTSSTSSGGSSTRDLEAKAALWGEYQQQPADVISRFDGLAETSAPRGRASDDNHPKHETSCRRMRARWEHCNCSCKQHRVAHRQARQEQRLSRWFSAMREQEGAGDGDDNAGDDADDEADAFVAFLQFVSDVWASAATPGLSCDNRRAAGRALLQTLLPLHHASDIRLGSYPS